jgi:hypothetical protein
MFAENNKRGDALACSRAHDRATFRRPKITIQTNLQGTAS